MFYFAVSTIRLFCIYSSLIEREIQSIFYVSVSFFRVFQTLSPANKMLCFCGFFSVCLVSIFIIPCELFCVFVCEGCMKMIYILLLLFSTYHILNFVITPPVPLMQNANIFNLICSDRHK